MTNSRPTDSPIDLEVSARDELVGGSQDLKLVLPDSAIDLEPVPPTPCNRTAGHRELQVQSEMLVDEHAGREPAAEIRKPR